MVRLRLKRMGSKKRPSYRIVAAEISAPRDGRYIEQIGFYDPLTDPSTVRFDEDRAKHWLSVGAQPTETVERLLKSQGLVEGSEAATTGAAAVA